MLKLNKIFEAEGLDHNTIQLIRHNDDRVRKSEGKSIFDIWFSDLPRFESYQSVQRNRFAFDVGGWVASFVVTNLKQTLFIGLYKVEHRRPAVERDWEAWPKLPSDPNSMFHALSLSNEMSEYVRRLTIEPWSDAINYVKNANRCNPTIKEIKSAPEDEAFPGYLTFSRRVSNLKSIFPSWQGRLSDQHGIYLLTFDDGGQYVGSASGDGGFWQRWSDYVQNGHGGNQALIRDGRDARTQAIVSILEVTGSAETRQDIVNREMTWQKKLGSRTKRLNSE